MYLFFRYQQNLKCKYLRTQFELHARKVLVCENNDKIKHNTNTVGCLKLS
jgi:hypothetical protein